MFSRIAAVALMLGSAGAGLAYPPLHYPYVSDARRAEAVRNAVPSLHRCMTEGQVTKMLGEPDIRRPLTHEGTNGDDLPTLMMIYVLSQRSGELAESDAQVVVWMSKSKTLKAVSVYGIPGLANIDGMNNEKCTS